MRRSRCLLTVACLLSIYASSALAIDPALAEALFAEGRALLQRGAIEQAYSKLSESQRIDPAVGTLLSLAECEEARGHAASAWSLWLEAASAARGAKQPDRETLARSRASALRAKLGTLSIEVPELARVGGLQIVRDGESVASAAWGTEAPLDSGEHVLSVTAPGKQAFQTQFQISAGRSLTMTVPELAPLPNPAVPLAASERMPAAATRSEATLKTSSDGPSAFRWLAWFCGLGGALLLVVLGLRSLRSSTRRAAAGPTGGPARVTSGWLWVGAGCTLLGAQIAYAAWARLILPRAAEQASADQAGVKVIRIAGDPWSGYSTFRGEPRLRDELAKEKLRIDYVDDPALYDQDARMRALAEGKIDAAVTTIDAFLQHGAKHLVKGQYPGVIIWNIDESNGGDAIFLAKGRKGFDSVLPTDKVCYSTGTPSEHLWDFASLSFANLGDKLATDNGVVASDCWKKLVEGKVQVAVLWQPSTAIALKAGYPKAFATGGQADDVIIDVLVVNRDFLAREGAALTSLSRAYFKVIDSYLKDPAAHSEFITKDCGPECAGDVGLGKAVLEGIDFLTYQENMCLWWGHCQAPPKMHDRILKTAKLLTAKDKLAASAVPNPSSVLDDRFLLELKKDLEKQSELAVSVVGKDTQIQNVKLEAHEKSYRYLAATAVNDPDSEVGTLRLPNIYFPEGRSDLDQNARSVVDVIAEQLRAFPALCVHVHGYTNSAGNPDNNRRLSEARARAIVDQLSAIDAEAFQHARFDVRGFGSTLPIVKDGVEDLVAGRRTEFKLFSCQQLAAAN